MGFVKGESDDGGLLEVLEVLSSRPCSVSSWWWSYCWWWWSCWSWWCSARRWSWTAGGVCSHSLGEKGKGQVVLSGSA